MIEPSLNICIPQSREEKRLWLTIRRRYAFDANIDLMGTENEIIGRSQARKIDWDSVNRDFITAIYSPHKSLYA